MGRLCHGTSRASPGRNRVGHGLEKGGSVGGEVIMKWEGKDGCDVCVVCVGCIEDIWGTIRPGVIITQ